MHVYLMPKKEDCLQIFKLRLRVTGVKINMKDLHDMIECEAFGLVLVWF